MIFYIVNKDFTQNCRYKRYAAKDLCNTGSLMAGTAYCTYSVIIKKKGIQCLYF